MSDRKEKGEKLEKGDKQDSVKIPIFVESPHQTNLQTPEIKKMIFIMNALDKGWSVKKLDGSYIFTKKHEGKREVFRENYLEKFVQSNFDMSNLASTYAS